MRSHRLLAGLVLPFLLTLGACGTDADAGGAGGAGGGGESRALTDLQDGIATYYEADGSGNCSFDAGPDIHVAALNAPQYADAGWCGACAAIEGPQGNVTVRIVDQCPECLAGHLDLHPEAFDRIADRVDGRVDIRWRFVTCPVTENVRYRFKEGSSQWWTALQVLDHRLPIDTLAWWNGSAWVDVPRASYNYFVAESGLGEPPYRIRLTAIDGQTLEDNLPSLQIGTIYEGAGQFE
ncbi:expansin EXLX1 family cellulose-binding protein [Vulgatibacter sp.]|uniref:expansin EXLX1 family cellulose-binding protein n=1 Tax=Vulgatibacter sp. TaxID=1971226 RepID=UPI00356604BE